ncbi:thermonuclease family protein [Pseudomonas aeruginosa]|uniref:thermonuclease family protein n=1 Tax=Pseudomonas aeruginosa TaxID=287 RepID=UPI0010481E98|nr:hypothetical protein [Pseudomonas aeruginosa]
MGAFFMSVISAFAGAAEACRPTGALQNVEVARVVDGDTVRLRDGRSVRLIGINAPELAHNGRTTEPFAVMQMAGRSLEVRGWVVDRSRRGAVPAGKARWQMSVTDPAMLEWLP